MTSPVDPLWISATAGEPSYSAREARLQAITAPMARAGILATLSGVLGQNALAVTATPTPSMSVDVAEGFAVIQGSTTTQGSYIGGYDLAQQRTLSPADPAVGRIDLIVLQIWDSIDGVGGGTDPDHGAELVVVEGTPAATPVTPAVPTDALALAQILLPAGATSVTDGDITDRRTNAASHGGVVLARDATVLPTAVDDGQLAWQVDTQQLLAWSAGQWHSVFEVAAGTFLGGDLDNPEVQGSVDGTTYTPTLDGYPDPIIAASLVVPGSGTIYVNLNCWMFAPPGVFTLASFTVEEGGITVVSPSNKRALSVELGATMRLSGRWPVQGLTPGAQASVTAMFRSGGVGDPSKLMPFDLWIEAG